MGGLLLNKGKIRVFTGSKLQIILGFLVFLNLLEFCENMKILGIFLWEIFKKNLQRLSKKLVFNRQSPEFCNKFA